VAATQRVTCPQGCGPGTTIEIQAPAANPGAGAPPPAPPPSASNTAPKAPATALGHQCAASAAAEQQLRTIQGAPPADLIFTAMDRDGNGNVTVEELQFGLSQGGNLQFAKRTCQMLVNMYDRDRDGNINRSEFASLWTYLSDWRTCFESHDRDRSGHISRAELKDAIEQIGYKFSGPFYERLFKIYDKENSNQLGFDSFIQLFCELHNLTEAFKRKDTSRTGQATFQYEDFLNAAYTIHE